MPNPASRGASSEPSERLPRTVGLFGAVAIIVGSTIGSGIFRVPAVVADRLGAPGPILLAWVLGGALALFGALTIAELAAMFPRSGGIFVYLEEAFGPLPAFLFGWSQLAVVRASALGGIATTFAEYLGYFTHYGTMGVRYTAALTILIVAGVNYLGVRHASRVMNVATVAKYVAMVALVGLAFTMGDGSVENFRASSEAAGQGVSFALVGAALVSVMWAYDGWADLSYMGAEIKDPGRNFPRSLVVGTASIVVVYLLLNAAYIYLVPVGEMGGEALIASTAAQRIPILGSAGAGVVAAIVMLSCFGTLNGSMLTNPRIFFAMADRGLFFKGIARVSPRYETPSAAIWLAAALGCSYVLFNDFQQLADRFVLGIWPFYILAIVAVFVLRRKAADRPRPYRTWGYPVVPAVFLIAATLMVVGALVTDPVNTGVTFGIIAIGIPVYVFTLGRKRVHKG